MTLEQVGSAHTDLRTPSAQTNADGQDGKYDSSLILLFVSTCFSLIPTLTNRPTIVSG